MSVVSEEEPVSRVVDEESALVRLVRLALRMGEHAAFLDSPRCPLLYWSYFFAFLAAYAVATVILRLLRRPIDMKAPTQKRRRKSDD